MKFLIGISVVLTLAMFTIGTVCFFLLDSYQKLTLLAGGSYTIFVGIITTMIFLYGYRLFLSGGFTQMKQKKVSVQLLNIKFSDVIGLEEAKRETLEETGYASDDWELIREEGKKSGKIIWDSFYYVARNCKKVQEQELDAGEKIELRFISFEEFLALADEPRFRTSVEFLLFLKELRDDKDKREIFRKKLFNN
jgi:hypothetical protein